MISNDGYNMYNYLNSDITNKTMNKTSKGSKNYLQYKIH